jgi:hypothetical protein
MKGFVLTPPSVVDRKVVKLFEKNSQGPKDNVLDRKPVFFMVLEILLKSR